MLRFIAIILCALPMPPLAQSNCADGVTCILAAGGLFERVAPGEAL